MNFAAAWRRLSAGDGAFTDLGDPHAVTVSPLTRDRPTSRQPSVQTDGLDPAAPGGPAPYNSAVGPYGRPVTSDPLLSDPIHPGQPIPHIEGPDVDALTLDHR